jgi:hypothetical protein
MESKKAIEREWIQWIAGGYPEIVPISDICSAPNCSDEPKYVCIGNITYCLCEKHKELVMFEKKYAAYKGKEKK